MGIPKLIFTENILYNDFKGSGSEQSYEIVNTTDDSVTVKRWNKSFKKYYFNTYYIDEDSIYAITTKYKVREYFKRTE